MNLFEQIPRKIKFECGNHPIERFCSDRFYPTFPASRAREYIISRAEQGQIINKYYSFRYKNLNVGVKSGNIYMPCVFVRSTVEYDIYLIRTVLTWDMLLKDAHKKVELYIKRRR